MSGYIYKLTNKINGKFYVGMTTKSVARRMKEHVKNSKSGKTLIQKAIRKYHAENFCIETIEETADLSGREKYWISVLKPEYNLTEGGERGDTSSSINFIESMKKYHSNKPRSSYATRGMLGKSQSAHNLAKIRESNNCGVVCDGVFYESIKLAEVAYPGIKIRYRLDSPKYPNFIRTREKTKRK